MKIEILNKISFSELEDKIREIPLMKPAEDNSRIKVYKNADISIKNLKADQVNPSTFYLLKYQIQLQKDLRDYLMSNYSIDSLNLGYAIEFRNEKEEIWTLAPPIIELTQRIVKYVPQKGEIPYEREIKINIPLICDGAHRINLARSLNIQFNAVYISNVDEKYHFYAHPNSWDMVKEVDEVPKIMEEKKLYRQKDSYALYRNFDTIGCGKPRHTGK